MVADPEVDATMNRRLSATLAFLLVLALVLGGIASLPAAQGASSTNPVTGSVQGPKILAVHGSTRLTINATGGPAFAANGTQVGNLTYYASIAGSDLTGVSVLPATNAFVLGQPLTPLLDVGATPEVLTITFEISSVYQTENVSTNLTYTVTVVQPYVVSATIYNPGSTSVLGFTVDVELDGAVIGNVSVPSISPRGTYNLSFQYATLGLSAGAHTFTISLANENGLVTFAGGATMYSTTVYVRESAPNNTVWYVLGGVAFVGVLFIFATRVAARRRGGVRK